MGEWATPHQCLELTPSSMLWNPSSRVQGPYVVLGIDPGLANCKASALAPFLSLWLLTNDFFVSRASDGGA